MSVRLLPRRCALLVVLAAGCGCVQVHAYQPPRPDEPHAIVKLRRVYETRGGDTLDEQVTVGNELALQQTVSVSVTATPRHDAIDVRARPTAIELDASFSHTETYTESESYQEQVPGTKTETYDCGTFDAPNTCTRTVDDSHYETRWRTVERSMQVSDGACKAAIAFRPSADHVYLLDFTFRGDHACTLACYEQVRGDDGGFQNAPCVVAKESPAT